MQVSVETTSNLGRKMTVQVPADNIDSEIENRLKSMGGNVRLDGFRPGKVPMRVVKQRFGQQVMQEVMGEFMQSSFQEAIAQEELRPAGGPVIDPKTMGVGEGLEYIATFEVYPEFELAGFDGLEVKKPVAEIQDSDIDEMLDALRKQRKTWEPVERAAQLEDQVTMDFVGSIGGEPFEGGAGEDMAIELGGGRLVPGFEDQLVGVKSGEERTLNVTFPEDYPQKNLAGKDARFDVKVKSVAEGKLPELTDEMAQAFGVDGGLEALREEARANMERELEEKVDERVKSQIMEGLCEANNFEVPEALVKQEIDRAREQMGSQFGQEMDLEKFPDEMFAEQGRRRVELGLIFGEIVKQYELTPDRDKVEERLNKMAASYEDPQQVISYYRSNAEAMSGIESVVLEQQVVECVLEHAKVSDERATFSELVKPQGAET